MLFTKRGLSYGLDFDQRRRIVGGMPAEQAIERKRPSSPEEESPISNVSDTARWIAAQRAIETRRADALFRDPLADRLAGEQGYAIVARGPWFGLGGGSTIARTKIIDDWVMDSVATGVDTVINLGAGLDTRPYRLTLPPKLTWIEADLPGILNEKERMLAGEIPVCRLWREKMDVADRPALSAFLDRATATARAVLVIAEGLLIYLEPETVRNLTRELAARPKIRWWVFTNSSPAGRRMMQKGTGRLMAHAPFKFAPPDGVAFFERLGWKLSAIESLPHAAARYKRGPWWLRALIAFLPRPDPRLPKGRSWSVVRLERGSPRIPA